MNFTSEDVERAVNAARSDGDNRVAEARAERDKRVAEARAEGDDRVAAAVTKERERMMTILRSPKAAGKLNMAVTVALAGTDVEAAEQILGAAPAEQIGAMGMRAKDAPGGLVLESMVPADPEATNGWDQVVAELNREEQKARR